MNTKKTLLACALLIAGGASFAAVQQPSRVAQDRQDRGDTQGHAGPFGRLFGSRHGRLGERLQRLRDGRKLFRSLAVTEQQKEQARGVVKSLQPIVDDVRPQALRLIGQARELARSGNRDAARELVRTELRPLVENAVERAKPLVEPLVGALTPEQHAKLEAAASRRGKAFDEARFTRRLTWMLALRGARH